MLIIVNLHFLGSRTSKALLILQKYMKSNQFKYPATALLAVFFCVITTQNMFALYKTSLSSKKVFIVQENYKYTQTPVAQHNFTDENVFENETEDESETGFNPLLPVFNCSHCLTSVVFPEKQTIIFPLSPSLITTERPLYSIICSFRI